VIVESSEAKGQECKRIRKPFKL